MSVLAFSTPVGTDRWWHVKCRTPTGVARWALPREQDDEASGPLDAETLMQRPGAVLVGDDALDDPLGSAVAVAFHPSGDRLAYVTDTDGTEHLQLRVRTVADPSKDAIVADSVSHSLCWGVGDGEDHLYFCRVDDTLRPHTVARSTNTGRTEDVVVEQDSTRSVRVVRCSTKDNLVVHSTSALSTLVYAIDGAGVVERFAGPDGIASMWHIDSVHAADGSRRWIALTDVGQTQRFRVCIAGGAPGDAVWTPIYEPRSGSIRAMHARTSLVLVEEVGPEGERYVALNADGASRVVAYTDRWQGRPARYVLDHASQAAIASFTVSTPIDPPFVVDVPLGDILESDAGADADGEADAPHAVRRCGRADSPPYEMISTDVSAPDGYTVPMTVLRRRDSTPHSPCVVEVYGAYGVELGRHYDPTVTALLDAGIVFAIAHVRGGSERGPGWHSLGTGVGKEDSIRDFVACLTEIGRHDWVDPQRLAAWGTSAGGTIVAATINVAPQLMHVAALDVPFVDPLGTASDESAPLALRDRPEWGDPTRDDAVRAAMLRYSPLQNARPGPHPKLRVTAGRNDPRAPLHDIERWLERLGAPPTALTVTDGGHGGDRSATVRWLIESLAPPEAVTDDIRTKRTA